MTSTLISTFSMLGSHIRVQERVADEVLQCPDASNYENAVRLYLTQASIREAQRLHPVIGMSMPRKVPDGGMRTGGLYLPPGTTVGCNPMSLHRNTDIFGLDTEEYIPERWLDGDNSRAMERYNLIWGAGARTCPGRNLAEMLVSKVVTALIEHFEIEASIPPDHEMPYYFMAMLTGVQVRFKPRERMVHGCNTSQQNAASARATPEAT